MSGKDLFEGMSYVDERFVDEAENKTLPKRVISPWIKVASMAACLCLIIFSLNNLLSYQRSGSGAKPGEVAPGAAIQDQSNQASQDSEIQAPAEEGIGEVPSVILRVEEMTDLGFIGTVAQLVDTDIFEIGMELNVVVADGTRHETADGNPSMSADSKADYSGSYVVVQFIEYDRETGTIIVNIIQEADAPETAP